MSSLFVHVKILSS